jgi:lysophospholipase L1-like esterase
LTAGNLGSAATNAASAFAPAAGPFPWADVTGAPSIQTPITLTTSGTSGAATFSSGTLNIPQYAGGVTSFDSRTGAVTLQASDLAISGASLTALPSSPSLYPVLNQNTTGTATYALNVPWSGVSGAPSFQSPITLTTSGASGAATFSSGTLNIPQYGSGSVTAFSAGNLSPLFTTSVATWTTTPALSFSLANAAQNSVLAGPATGGAGVPSYQTTPAFSGANLTSLHGYETATYSAAATSTLTVLGRVSEDNVVLNAGSGAYTVNLVLSATGAQSGDVWEIPYAMPASLNPSLQIIDGASSGTLTTGTQTLANSGTTTLQFFFNGTNWIHAAKGALLTRNLNSTAQADLAIAPNSAGGLLTLGGGMASNGDAVYLPQFLAKLNKVRAGAATNVKVLLIGDSTTAGYGATTNTNFAGDKVLSPSFLIANRLSAAGIPAYDAGWYGLGNNGGSSSTLTLYDPRVTYGAGWTQYFNSFCLGGGFMESSNSTDTLTFSPGFLYNTIEVYYVINPGNGSITINNGGSALGTINTAGTAAVGKATYTVSLGNNPVNIQATSSTVTYIAGVLCYNTNTPGVLFINGGMGNATTADMLGTGWGAEGSIATLSPDLSIINLMINDCNNGSISSGTYQSNLSTLVTYCQNYGNVMLVTPVPAGATTYLSNASAFLAATKAVAASDNTALVDVSSLMPSYSVQNTLGLRFDTLHPNAAGYQYYASLVANELLQICAPTSATQVTQTTVSGSTAGSAVFSEPFQGANYKKVVVQLGSSLSGTATFTLPTPFLYTPTVINSDVAVTTSGTGTIVVTGTGTLPRTVILEGY